jgi:hypothetical protein
LASTSSRDNVIKAKLLNRGTDVWEVEHECKRPKASGLIYNPEKVQAAVTPLHDIERPTGTVRRAVGVDWGRYAVAILAERNIDHVLVSEAKIFDSRPISDLVQYLVELRARVGDFVVYGDAENAYGNLDCRNAGFEVVPVPFNKFKDEGIENIARYFEHGKIKIADEGDLQTVVRQLLRYHRNESGKIVKQDDHGPDALLCAMLHFPFVDEFDTALSNLLSGVDRERLKVTDKLLDACICKEAPVVKEDHTCTMGVSMGSVSLFVVVSTAPDARDDSEVRQAIFIGRVKRLSDLDEMMEKYRVSYCLISLQPEPHLVHEWSQERHHGRVYKFSYTNDGQSGPRWDQDERTVTVDRTYALDSAYEEIRARHWLLPVNAREIDGGEFYAQMKAPTRVRDITSGEIRYRWTEVGALDHYRHAHAYDHLAAEKGRYGRTQMGMAVGTREALSL